MAKLFSKRKRPPQAGYSYDFPLRVRRRIMHSIAQIPNYSGSRHSMLPEVEQRLLVEYGELTEATSPETQDRDPIIEHYYSCDTDQFLDFLEVLFQTECHCECRHGVAAINEVLRDEGIGYELSPFIIRTTTGERDEFSGGQTYREEYDFPKVVVKDSEVLHSEAVEPALQLLTDPRYKGANEEYLRSHEYFRKGDNIGCMNECLKAFESTMKIICHHKGWQYDQKDTASKLIKACLDNGLLPAYSQEHLTLVRTLLETAIPTPRNKQSGHGQGVQQNTVPDSLAKFALHTTAATILLLIEAANE